MCWIMLSVRLPTPGIYSENCGSKSGLNWFSLRSKCEREGEREGKEK